MARLPITESECNNILLLPKQITSDIVWTKKTNKSWASSKVSVESGLKSKLDVVLTVNVEEPSKFSITLLLSSMHRIRSLDMCGSHYNKCSDRQRWDSSMHKHCWNDYCPGGHAYTPTDINGVGLRDVFTQFCNECNIKFLGHFNPLPIQIQLPRI